MKMKTIACVIALMTLAFAAGSFVGCESQAKSLYDDFSLINKLEGEIVYSIDPATKEALPQGSEIRRPVNMERAIV